MRCLRFKETPNGFAGDVLIFVWLLHQWLCSLMRFEAFDEDQQIRLFNISVNGFTIHSCETLASVQRMVLKAVTISKSFCHFWPSPEEPFWWHRWILSHYVFVSSSSQYRLSRFDAPLIARSVHTTGNIYCQHYSPILVGLLRTMNSYSPVFIKYRDRRWEIIKFNLGIWF